MHGEGFEGRTWTGSTWRGESLLLAVERGDVDEVAIDESVRRLLHLLVKVGAFEHPQSGPEEGTRSGLTIDYFDNPDLVGSPVRVYYGEGLFVGYRYYEKKKIAPLFPFGFGLSIASPLLDALELQEVETFFHGYLSEDSRTGSDVWKMSGVAAANHVV